MTYTLDTFSFDGTPIEDETSASIVVHEIAGANDAFVQYTGTRNKRYQISAVLEEADRATLKAMVDEAGELRTFSDTSTGISADVLIETYKQQEARPGLWYITITLVEAPL